MDYKKKQQELWGNKGEASAEHYWKFPSHIIKSKWFVEFLKKIDFNSIFEAGCNSGRNLWHIEQNFPKVSIGGLDICQSSINFAKTKIPNVDLEVGSIYDIDTDKKFDIVFTSGVLLHIPQDGIEDVISKFVSKANSYVIHLETNGPDRIINGPSELAPERKIKPKLRCEHNYKRLYGKLGITPTIGVIPNLKETDCYNFIVADVRNHV